ncbi:MAG TPA: Gfo/Idh/MocA family oxidoreductase [Tepidisphaeraceae bacterium]|jgi:predicted dehydrogenase|nr:Gfo/Idh/MocA family oxidoreductase [Tepidisphaeraceae bacterium]
MAKTVKLGVIGCGKISGAYFGMAKNFPMVEVVACADLNIDAAKKAAEQYSIPKACSVEELLKDESVELVINLTIPKAHVPVGLQCVAAGKHMYAEKPLGVNIAEGVQLLEAARRANVKIGCAPDTFMGAGIQTARKAVEEGAIGRPHAFTAFMMGRGHESWHPSPEFYYEVGGGPMFDMGPYYLTALLNMFGKVKRISGMTTVGVPERTITSEPKKGKKIKVETPDHVTGLIEFENGVVGTIIQSFAAPGAHYNGNQPITIFGDKGTMRVPDPNTFDGTVSVADWGSNDWTDLPHTFVKGYGRSVGAADMAYAIRSGRPHRASGDLALSVLELMQGFQDSSDSSKFIAPAIPFERPKAMPADLPFGTLDE